MTRVARWHVTRWLVSPLNGFWFGALVVAPLLAAALLCTWLCGVNDRGNLHWRDLASLVNDLKTGRGGLESVVDSWKVDGRFTGTQALAFAFGFGLLHGAAHLVGMG